MQFQKEFAAIERRAEMLGWSPYDVAISGGVPRLRYWRAREGKVRRISARVRVLDVMKRRLAELEERKANGMDLFDYPASPGFKEGTTSKDAAKSVAGQAPRLRKLVLDAIESAGTYGLTTHECAGRIGLSVFSVAPRFTELQARGQIEKTDKKRPNASGRQARVWRKV